MKWFFKKMSKQQSQFYFTFIASLLVGMFAVLIYTGIIFNFGVVAFVNLTLLITALMAFAKYSVIRLIKDS